MTSAVHDVELRKHVHGVIMSFASCNRARGKMETIVGAESDQQWQEREAKEKADADAGGGAIPPPPRLITEQSFL